MKKSLLVVIAIVFCGVIVLSGCGNADLKYLGREGKNLSYYEFTADKDYGEITITYSTTFDRSRYEGAQIYYAFSAESGGGVILKYIFKGDKIRLSLWAGDSDDATTYTGKLHKLIITSQTYPERTREIVVNK